MRHLVYQLTIAIGLSLFMLLNGAGGALAMGGDSANASLPEFKAGLEALEKGDWPEAKRMFTKVTMVDPTDADAYNYLGLAHRKAGDYDQAFAMYEKALQLNPKHKGAHEYIGQAYLEQGNLEKAEFHLDRLDDICFFSCAEYRSLKQSVADYKTKS